MEDKRRIVFIIDAETDVQFRVLAAKADMQLSEYFAYLVNVEVMVGERERGINRQTEAPVRPFQGILRGAAESAVSEEARGGDGVAEQASPRVDSLCEYAADAGGVPVDPAVRSLGRRDCDGISEAVDTAWDPKQEGGE